MSIVDAKERFKARRCGHCLEPIRKGEAYREVRSPNGDVMPVHEGCLDRRTKK